MVLADKNSQSGKYPPGNAEQQVPTLASLLESSFVRLPFATLFYPRESSLGGFVRSLVRFLRPNSDHTNLRTRDYRHRIRGTTISVVLTQLRNLSMRDDLSLGQYGTS